MSEFIVLREHPDMLSYIDGLQRANAEALSFYPRVTFEREQQAGRLFLGMLNGEPCGYIWTGAPGRDLRCHQVCIQYDARRRFHGAALVAVMEQHATDTGAASITLRCGFDLEANAFWPEMGYACIAHKAGGARRMRTINIWRKQLQPELFETVAIEPALGKRSMALWSKNRTLGTVTQFVRGRRMREYRATVEMK